VAILLTNEPNLWSPSGRRFSNDREFHIPEGTTLTGTLRWAKGLYPGNTRTLSGTYPVQWQNYSSLDGTYGTLRWLAVEVGTSRSAVTPWAARPCGGSRRY